MSKTILNKKAIIINGFAHGGTNILWNIMQSHVNICSPIYETNQILENSTILNPRIRYLIKHPGLSFAFDLNRYIDNLFNRYKLENILHADNKYKTEDGLYTFDEINNSTICIKGVFSPSFQDINYSGLFDKVVPETYHVSIMRNGLALCEGWKRRGISPEITGSLYTNFMKKIVSDKEKFKNYAIIDFDKLIELPFEYAEKLFRFCHEEPFPISSLRLKIKKTLNSDGKHEVGYGIENKKYWFDRTNIREILVTEISSLQTSLLTNEDRRKFYRFAEEGINIYNKILDVNLL